MTENNALRCRRIAAAYGFDNQVGQTAEEACELVVAIHKYKRHPTQENIIAVMEEIADVFIMIEQMRFFLNISEDGIQKIIDEKITRQLQRIENKVQ